MEQALELLSNGPEALKVLYAELSEAEKETKVDLKEVRELNPPEQARKLQYLVLEPYTRFLSFFSEMKSMLEYTAVQRRLGHSSAALTLGTYSRLLADDLKSSTLRANELATGVEGTLISLQKRQGN
jgi:hypothetical protein